MLPDLLAVAVLVFAVWAAFRLLRVVRRRLAAGDARAVAEGWTVTKLPWGGRVYRDLMKVTDALEKLPYVDTDRVGVMGWSYGGYMTMWMQGHTDRYQCIASMMGVYDLEAMYGATEELWFPEHDLKGTPWKSDEYAKWSPVKFVEHFKTPALVVTGEKDYRVPYTQSLEFFTALQRQDVPSRLLLFPDEGHWILKPQNSKAWYGETLAWLKKHL